MDGTLRILLVVVAATIPAALIHELGRAAAALLLTKGRVIVLLGSGRPLFSVRIGRVLIAPTARALFDGECLHEPTTSPRRATAILLAGPLVGDVVFLAAAAAAATWNGGVTEHPTVQLALFVFALVALTRASADLVRAVGSGPRLAVAAKPVASAR
ncbi:hypothetical protein DSM104299_00291 [Baekduia alba]|uniref:hypothetical protein n=1 Tax=Baekduia alba TaxID=2997333 RepID=UPI00233FBF37|nr:hypothetical protein [Baekduia alba]WCB91618.1 hypothetical protein DSM104299_00291 [Baekduia alba]